MSDASKECCLCKAGNLKAFFTIYCRHIVCESCYKLHKKENYFECIICNHNYNPNFCKYTANPQNNLEGQTKCPPRYLSEFDTIKKEIIQLEDLISRIKSIHTECESHFYQNQAWINFIFEQFKRKIDLALTESISKLKQYKEGNQKYLNDYQDYIQAYINQRKDLLSSIENSWKCQENTDLSKELNELAQFNTQYLQISKCQYKNDCQEAFDQILNTINAVFEFYNEIIPIELMDIQEVDKTLKEQEINNEGRQKNLNTNEKNYLLEDLSWTHNFVMEKIEFNDQKLVEIVEDDKIGWLDDKNDFKLFRPKQNVVQCRRGKNDFSLENEKARLGSKADWFIEIGDFIKELPQFVCDQINRFRNYKTRIYIERDGEIINFVDLQEMNYFKLLNGKKTNRHRLINLAPE